MGYIDGDLMSGEQVICRTQLHWKIFLWPILLLLIVIPLLLLSAIRSWDTLQSDKRARLQYEESIRELKEKRKGWSEAELRAYGQWPQWEPPVHSSDFFFLFVFNAPLMILLLVGTGWGILAYISFKTSEFGITNERVLVKVGVIRRKSLEILLKNVEAIQVNQGVLGRMLNYGTVQAIGTGGTRNRLRGIVKPLEFRKKLQEQVASVQQTH